jgi:hypothetical protein
MHTPHAIFFVRFNKVGEMAGMIAKMAMKSVAEQGKAALQEQGTELLKKGDAALQAKVQDTVTRAVGAPQDNTRAPIAANTENVPVKMNMDDAKKYASSILSKSSKKKESTTVDSPTPTQKTASKGGGMVGVAIVTGIGVLALLANLIVFLIFKAIFKLKSPYRTKKPKQVGEESDDNSANIEGDALLSEAEGMEETSDIPELDDEGGGTPGTMHKGLIILYWVCQLLLSSLFVGIFYQLLAKTKLSEYIPPQFTLVELFYPFVIFQAGWFVLTLFGIISDILSDITSIPKIIKEVFPELMNIVPIKLFFISEPPNIRLNRVSKPKFFAIHLYFFLFPLGMILLGWAFVALRVVKDGL